SLMALTVATGFVVDDAIVMIENVVRHIEDGERPLAAAFKGAAQIGFTIVSLTVSLIAVFIPLLFMTGVVGRLFSEFAIVLSVSVVVSAVVSLTVTPMMCARLLRPAEDEKPGMVSRLFERGFTGSLGFYRRTLHWSLRHERLVLLIALLTLAGTGWLYVITPKGFLPTQDTGVIIAVTEAEQSISIPRMSTLQAQAADIVRADPAVAGVVSFVGAGAINPTPNAGQLTIALKPRRERDASAQAVADRLGAKLAAVPGLSAYMQPVQDIQIGTRISRTQYQYTLTDTDPAELATWAPRLLDRLRALPGFRDVTTDQQNEGFRRTILVDRDAAMRLGVSMQSVQDALYDAFGQRQISTIFAASNQYRVVLEADPSWQANPDSLLLLRVPSTMPSSSSGGTSTSSSNASSSAGAGAGSTSGTGSASPATAQVPLSAFATIERTTAPLVITREAQFPSVTLSFNLAPGTSLGEAVGEVAQAEAEIGLPATIAGGYSGDAAEFQNSLAAEPWLILAAIVVIYIVLGVLYESFIHPVTILSTLPSAGIGALLALMLAGQDL
ncbi:MAG TPA: efflux RND transporter permease subunit, partial [Acetobacteraceae bacterium]